MAGINKAELPSKGNPNILDVVKKGLHDLFHPRPQCYSNCSAFEIDPEEQQNRYESLNILKEISPVTSNDIIFDLSYICTIIPDKGTCKLTGEKVCSNQRCNLKL